MSSDEPAPDPVDPNQMLKDLQSWWEIPSIAQYISLFRESFNLPEIEIEELEKGLIDDSTKGPSSWLQDLTFSLVRSYMPGRANAGNFESHLQKLVNRKWPADREKPFPEDKSFSQLTLRSKVEIIYSLCLYRLDRNDIGDVMKSMDADALRVQKLGLDDLGNTYWYFYGTRLYKEESCKDEKASWDEEWKKQKKKTFKKRGRGRPRKVQLAIKSDGESEDFEYVDAKNNGYMNADAKSRWSVVCDTIEEWVAFAEKFKTSKSKNEKALFQIVQENFLPTLNKIYEEKEKKLQQKLRDLMPSREKIVTRRETRKQRGDTFESPVVNGYSSSSDEPYKMHMKKDRARRLEERHKRASDAVSNEIQRRKRQRFSDTYENFNPDPTEVEEDAEDDNEYGSALTPKIDGQKMDLQSQMERLMSGVKLHKDAWPFLYPVNEDDVPGYYEIIKEPVDLSTIDTRLRNGEYETVAELDADFSQMVTNCELYNGEQHAYSKMVQTLWRMFRKGISDILDSLPYEENSNVGTSDENSSSSNSDLLLRSPHIRTDKKKKEERKRKKKKNRMEALDMLAQATELAVQTTNSNDMLNESLTYDAQKKPNDFSNLKISTTHSHPPSLIEKFSSESSPESYGDADANYNSYSTYLNQDIGVNEQSSRSSPEGGRTHELVGSNLAHLASFMEKNDVQSLNILSNNDVTNVLSDSSSSHHENSSSPSSSFSKESGNMDHGLDNILDNENVSNIISQIIKQPMYNSNNQLMSQCKEDNPSSYVDNLPRQQDIIVNKNTRKSPPSGYVSPTSVESLSLMQGMINAQSDLGSPSNNNMTTIDASVIGISSYNTLPKKQTTNSNMPVVMFANGESHPGAVPSIGHERVSPKTSPCYQPQMSPNELLTQQYYGSSGLMNNNSTTASVPNASYQSYGLAMPVTSSQTTFVSPGVDSTCSMPLQVPATYPMSVQQQQQQIQTQGNVMRVSVPQPGSRIVVMSEANTGSGVTYHLYTQAKSDQNVNGNYASYAPVSSASAIRVSPNLENRITDNQETVVQQASPPLKKSPVPQQFQGSPRQVPSKGLPCYAPVSTTSPNLSRTSLPVTSSNFIPVNSIGKHSKPTIIRTKVPESGSGRAENVVTSFVANPNTSLPYNGIIPQNNNLYHKAAPKTLVYSGYSQSSNQNDPRFKHNQNATVSMQLPNGMPIIQQVLIPAGQQQVQVQNGGRQIVFASPQRLFNSNPISQTQNNVRQLNQGFAKVMPQMVAQQGPIMQVSRDMMQGLQFQAVAQNGPQSFTQLAQNPQFVNMPTYMITNQNQVQGSSPPQTVMSLQQYQQLTAQRRQMPMNGQGNG